MMHPDDGTAAVRIARGAIIQEVTRKPLAYMIRLTDNEKRGVFVTVNTYPSRDLRGCIGFTEPVYPLSEALEYAARSACRDPRFPPLREKELDKVVVEVTILTPPEPMIVKEKEELLNTIKIGRHGLMLEYRGRRGVFLPQVPAEWGWDVKEYLENLCMKAGVSKDKWKESDCNIFSFEGRIFGETSPNGDVEEVKC